MARRYDGKVNGRGLLAHYYCIQKAKNHLQLEMSCQRVELSLLSQSR